MMINAFSSLFFFFFGHWRRRRLFSFHCFQVSKASWHIFKTVVVQLMRLRKKRLYLGAVHLVTLVYISRVRVCCPLVGHWGIPCALRISRWFQYFCSSDRTTSFFALSSFSKLDRTILGKTSFFTTSFPGLPRHRVVLPSSRRLARGPELRGNEITMVKSLETRQWRLVSSHRARSSTVSAVRCVRRCVVWPLAFRVLDVPFHCLPSVYSAAVNITMGLLLATAFVLKIPHRYNVLYSFDKDANVYTPFWDW